MSLTMKTTVIISAYMQSRDLRYVLLGYATQTVPADEIIVTQDGTDPAVAKIVQDMRNSGLQLIHLTQEHRGFGKCRALNQAIQHARGDHLIFTDGDCIPRNDFVQKHRTLIRPGTFLAGGSHISLPQDFHRQGDLDAVIHGQELFQYAYLNAIPGFNKSRFRLTRHTCIARPLDIITQRNAFISCNASAFKHDLLAVGGFDEAMQYGGEDLNIGLRLNNIGIKGVRARYSLVNLHLDHPRGYRDLKIIAANKAWNKEVKKRKLVLPLSSQLLT